MGELMIQGSAVEQLELLSHLRACGTWVLHACTRTAAADSNEHLTSSQRGTAFAAKSKAGRTARVCVRVILDVVARLRFENRQIMHVYTVPSIQKTVCGLHR